MWRRDQIVFRLLDSLCEDGIVTLEVLIPTGVILIMGEPEDVGQTLLVHRVHIHSDPPHPVGTANLGVIAQAMMQRYGYDEIIIEGARRESGRRFGQIPRTIRYRRRAEPAA